MKTIWFTGYAHISSIFSGFFGFTVNISGIIQYFHIFISLFDTYHNKNLEILNLTRDIRNRKSHEETKLIWWVNQMVQIDGSKTWVQINDLFLCLLHVYLIYERYIRYIICHEGTLYAKQELTARWVSNFENWFGSFVPFFISFHVIP